MTAHFVPTIYRLVIVRPREAVGFTWEFQGRTREVGPWAAGDGCPRCSLRGLCMMTV